MFSNLTASKYITEIFHLMDSITVPHFPLERALFRVTYWTVMCLSGTRAAAPATAWRVPTRTSGSERMEVGSTEICRTKDFESK